MATDPKLYPEEDEKAPAPEVVPFTQYKLLKTKGLDKLVTKREMLKMKRAALDIEIHNLDALIVPLMDEARVKSVMVFKYRVTYVADPKNSRLDKYKLIEYGVAPELIQRATVISPRKPYVTISDTTKKEKSQEGDSE